MEKTFDPKTIEARWYPRWEASGAFKPSGKGEPYAIMLPPPNVTGTLHMGHAFQHTLMDALIRYHRMLGRDTLWQLGTDHAGIATEMVVARLLEREGKTRDGLGRDAFVDGPVVRVDDEKVAMGVGHQQSPVDEEFGAQRLHCDHSPNRVRRSAASLSATMAARSFWKSTIRWCRESSAVARIRTASRPALRAPPIDTVATGTPAGICTIDRSESIPSRYFNGTGTPMTGSGVAEATIPGRCAAPPAPAMMTESPRSAAFLA